MPTTCGLCLAMASTNFSGGTSTPRSTTSKPDAAEHRDDDVLADVVDVVLHRAHHHGAARLGRLPLLQQRAQFGHHALHDHAGEHQVGQEALAGGEAVAQLDHAAVALGQDVGGRHAGGDLLAHQRPSTSVSLARGDGLKETVRLTHGFPLHTSYLHNAHFTLSRPCHVPSTCHSRHPHTSITHPQNDSKHLPDVHVAQRVDVFPHPLDELLVAGDLAGTPCASPPRECTFRADACDVRLVRSCQYTPYSRVNSVIARRFSAFVSSCMMALASMMYPPSRATPSITFLQQLADVVRRAEGQQVVGDPAADAELVAQRPCGPRRCRPGRRDTRCSARAVRRSTSGSRSTPLRRRRASGGRGPKAPR